MVRYTQEKPFDFEDYITLIVIVTTVIAIVGAFLSIAILHDNNLDDELVEVKVLETIQESKKPNKYKYLLEVTETGQRTWTEHYRGDENEIFTIDSELLNDYEPDQPLVEVEIIKRYYDCDGNAKYLLEVTKTKQRIVIDKYRGKPGETFKIPQNFLVEYIPPPKENTNKKEKDFIQIAFE